jgi:predicted dehydrogenase
MITGKPLSPASTPPPSILVVGCGSIGERHLRCFLKTGRARVQACESNPTLAAKIADQYQVDVSQDLSAAIGRRFDGVVICTPAPSHVEIARTALQHGSHVLIEKPLSQSLAGVADLLAERDRAQRAAAVAFTQHSYPILREVRAFLSRQEFGPVASASPTSARPTLRPITATARPAAAPSRTR